MLIALELEGKVLSINGHAREALSVDCEVSVIASADVELEAGTGCSRTWHGLSILGDLTRAVDESLGLLFEGGDCFFGGHVRGKKHNTHTWIGVSSVDLLHGPGMGGIIDVEHASPLDGAKDRLGLGKDGGKGEGGGGELHRCNDRRLYDFITFGKANCEQNITGLSKEKRPLPRYGSHILVPRASIWPFLCEPYSRKQTRGSSTANQRLILLGSLLLPSFLPLERFIIHSGNSLLATE